ncbi:hypothetical protein [Nesterenkonia lacusekhoensis]|nr:hypothetical protein [Nesterenkonia lacusekhoensis]
MPKRGNLDHFAGDAWEAAEASVPQGDWEAMFERAAQLEYFYIGALWARTYIKEQEDE